MIDCNMIIGWLAKVIIFFLQLSNGWPRREIIVCDHNVLELEFENKWFDGFDTTLYHKLANVKNLGIIYGPQNSIISNYHV